jgi:hypothetical protein
MANANSVANFATTPDPRSREEYLAAVRPVMIET